MNKKSLDQMNSVFTEMRDIKIAEANEIINQSRFNLSTREQKIILFLISKIEPGDMELKELEFSMQDFYKVCKLDGDSSNNYLKIKKIIQELYHKGFEITIKNVVKTKARWIKGVLLSKKNGTISMTLDNNLEPYILRLRAKLTQGDLMQMLEMTNQYSIKLYELLKNYPEQCEIEFSIEELKRLLFAEKYTQFNDFKRVVLDIAMDEIANFSDLIVSYELKRDDRKYTGIIFSMEKPAPDHISQQLN